MTYEQFIASPEGAKLVTELKAAAAHVETAEAELKKTKAKIAALLRNTNN